MLPTRALGLRISLVLFWFLGTAVAAHAEPLVFERDVRPILKAHCFYCHGEEEEVQGGLDVRLVRLLVAGGDSDSAIHPGDPENSLLWQRIAADEMPEGPTKLSDAEKETIRRWIAEGAQTIRPEPENPDEAEYTEEELGHWAFQPVRSVQPPSIDSVVLQGGNAIDRFLAARLAAEGLRFSPEADRRTLIRRVTFDLTGLAPTAAEIDAFLSDTSPDAWERVVDRLLGSPAYGVRWGRHWLDVAGYAESDGNLGDDRPRPHAWHYRDYVIASMNADKPYDQFLIEQLAGDELIEGTPDGNNPQHVQWMAATGFLRMAPDVTETNNALADRNQAVADMVNVVSTAVLGLTVGCAQCHDHRFDPISIEDYYQFRAIFDPLAPLHAWRRPSERLFDLTDDETRAVIERIEQQANERQADLDRRRLEHCQKIQDRAIASAPEEVQADLRAAVDTPAHEQTEAQKQLLSQYPTVVPVPVVRGLLIEYDREAHDRFQAEDGEIAAFRATKPTGSFIMAATEAPGPPPSSAVFFRGDPASPKDPVEPGELTVLARGRALEPLPMGGEGESTGRRLAYARQITDPSHPLVARVAVNRIWSHYFGRGLVASTGDFGLAGDRPSHPDLLDYLARDFVQHGWRMKRMHRMIVTSRAYRQSSQRGESDAVDPENILLARMPLRRLEAEPIRDALLQCADLLAREMGGPSVPVAVDGEGKAVVGTRKLLNGLFNGIDPAGEQEYRRSIFISTRRDSPLNMLATFDLPAMSPNCLRRPTSTVAPQALWFMNDQQIVALSEAMAQSLRRAAPGRLDDQIHLAYVRAFAAEPTDEELDQCTQFVTAQTERFRQDPNPEWQQTLASDPAAAELRGLASLCQVLVSTNRFLYLP